MATTPISRLLGVKLTCVFLSDLPKAIRPTASVVSSMLVDRVMIISLNLPVPPPKSTFEIC